MISEEKESEARQAIEKVLRRELSHTFSVAVGTQKSSKRFCQLCGPIIYITDPSGVAVKIQIYLPEWQMSMKKAKRHRTIIFNSNIPEFTLVKLKTKNVKLAEFWYKNMNQANEDVRYLKIRHSTHHVLLNKDGIFSKVTMVMTNEGTKFLYKNSILYADLPRYPAVHASPYISDFQRIHVYRGESEIVATIRCTDPLKTRIVLLTLNAQVTDIETVPEFFLASDTNDVPELSDSVLADSGPSLGKPANPLYRILLGPDEDEEEEEEEEEEEAHEDGTTPKVKFQSPRKRAGSCREDRYKKLARSGVLSANDKEAFAILMAEKEDKLMSLPRNEKPPNAELMIQNMALSSVSILGIPEGGYPEITLPELEDESMPFEMPRSCVTEQLFSDVVIGDTPIPHVTMRTNYQPTNVLKGLPDYLRDGMDLLLYKPTEGASNAYDGYLKQLEEIEDGPDRILAMVGMFLQGRAVSISVLYKGLSMLKFPIKKISECIANHQFTSISKCIEFMSKLCENNLVGFFFKTLERLHQFRDTYYYPDAFMRCEGFCEDIARIMSATKPGSKLGVKSLIDKTPPFYNVVCPHVGFATMVQRFREKCTENWIVAAPPEEKGEDEEEQLVLNEQRKECPPFAMIIAYVMFLMAGKNMDIIYKGEYGHLAGPILDLEPILEEPVRELIKDLHNKEIPRRDAVVWALIKLVTHKELPGFLVTFASGEGIRYNERLQEYMLSIHELLKLDSCFPDGVDSQDASLFAETQPILGHLLKRRYA